VTSTHLEGVYRRGEEIPGSKSIGGIDRPACTGHVVVTRHRKDGHGRFIKELVEHLPFVGAAPIGDVALDHEQFGTPFQRLFHGGSGTA